MSDPFGAFDLLGAPGDSGPAPDPGPDDALPEDVIRVRCEEWVQQAGDLRFSRREAIWPGSQASPPDVSEALVSVRARLDAVEVFLFGALTLKNATAAQAREQEQAADDAWDTRAREDRSPRPEYQGSKERYAWWNLDIRQERRRAREARALADFVLSAYESVKLARDGLNETRRDLVARLSQFRWESHMES